MAPFKHSCVLFIDPLGEPIEFFMRPCSDFSTVQEMIEHGGGVFSTQRGPGIIHLVDPRSKLLDVSEGETLVSVQYIYDCVEKNIALDMSSYIVNVSSVDISDISEDNDYEFTSNTAVKTGVPYDSSEDKKIINFILENKSDYLSLHYKDFFPKMLKAGIVHRNTSSIRKRIQYIVNHIDRCNMPTKKVKAFVDIFYKRRKKIKCYTLHDDLCMINYISERNLYSEIPKLSLYRSMQQLNITCHTAVSMQKHFQRYVLKNIECYDIPEHIRNLLLQGAKQFNSNSNNAQIKIEDLQQVELEQDDKMSDESDNNEHSDKDISMPGNETVKKSGRSEKTSNHDKQNFMMADVKPFSASLRVMEKKLNTGLQSCESSERTNRLTCCSAMPCAFTCDVKDEIPETELVPVESDDDDFIKSLKLPISNHSRNEGSNTNLCNIGGKSTFLDTLKISSVVTQVSDSASVVSNKGVKSVKYPKVQLVDVVTEAGSTSDCSLSCSKRQCENFPNSRTVISKEKSSEQQIVDVAHKDVIFNTTCSDNEICEDSFMNSVVDNFPADSHLKSDSASVENSDVSRNCISPSVVQCKKGSKRIRLKLYDPEYCPLVSPKNLDNLVANKQAIEHNFKKKIDSTSTVHNFLSDTSPVGNDNDVTYCEVDGGNDEIFTSTPNFENTRVVSPSSTPNALDSYDLSLLNKLRNRSSPFHSEIAEQSAVLYGDEWSNETVVATQEKVQLKDITLTQQFIGKNNENHRLIEDESCVSQDVSLHLSETVSESPSLIDTTIMQHKNINPSCMQTRFLNEAAVVVYKLEEALSSLNETKTESLKVSLQKDLEEMKLHLYTQLLTKQVEKVMRKPQLSVADQALLTKYLAHVMKTTPENILHGVLNSF